MTLFSLPFLCLPSRPYRLILTAVLAVLIASGCGQKGALYLPDDPSEMQTLEPVAGETAGGEPAEEAAAEDDDEDAEEDGEPSRRPPNEGNLP